MVGGVANSVYGLVRRLRALNHKVSVITAGLESSGIDDYVWRLPVLLRIEREWGDVIFCPSVYTALRKTAFDIVHAHTPRKLFAEFVALCKLFNRRRLPYVVSVRLVNTSLPTPMRWFSNLYLKTVEKFVFKHAEAVVVQTEANKRFLERNCKITPAKVRIIPNAVDTILFDPDRYNQDNVRRKYEVGEAKTVVFAGRLTTQKGLEHLFRAALLVKRDMPCIKFVIAGTGPQEQYLKALNRSLGIEGNVKFLGEVYHDMMPEIHSLADIFVLPSLSESFPNVMLEAMAMRKPVVATRVGVIPEILENRKTAILVQPANPEELAKAILEVLTDKNLARELGKRARELVQKEYTWFRVINETLEVYESAMD